MKKIIFLFFILNLVQHHSFAQKQGQELVDSLLLELPKINTDSNKVNVLFALSDNYEIIGEYEKALKYGNEGLVLAQKIKYKKGEAKCYHILGITNKRQGDYEKALENHFASLKLKWEIGDKKGIAASYNSIGNVYYEKGNYDKTMENYLASLRIRQEIGDYKGIALSYTNIGNVYLEKGNYDKALENQFAALKIRQEIGDKGVIATSYNNIGNVYGKQGDYHKALEYHLASLKIKLEIGDKKGIADSYMNIGNVYYEKGNYNNAMENYFASLKIDQEIGNKKGISSSYLGIGNVYLKKQKIKESKENFIVGLNIAKEIGSNESISSTYLNLASCDSASGNWKGAYEYHKLYKEYYDSIFNEESEKKTAQMSALYESEKKDGEIKLLNKDKEKQAAVSAAESKRQKTILLSVLGGLFLVVVFSIFMYNRWRVTKQQKNIISEQKLVVEHQKEIVEEKNKEITDSITYALRIQTAILPPQKIVKQYLDDSFILYKPKDIVAGDFYWMETALSKSSGGEELILFAACDCTGHGVPGAMVSVVCHNALNRAVREPAAILDKTAEIVIENFSKSEEEIKDGMDISLCAYNAKTKTMQWAGANNPLWLLRNGELIETKGDKQAIGINEISKPFTNHTFNLNTTDTIYLFTDGFADQFGGETGQKKLTRKRFKDLILSIQSKTLQEQGIALDKFITEYGNEIEQIDDILVMGVKI
jgi:tetratricopeptide (TPR) repeat protein